MMFATVRGVVQYLVVLVANEKVSRSWLSYEEYTEYFSSLSFLPTPPNEIDIDGYRLMYLVYTFERTDKVYGMHQEEQSHLPDVQSWSYSKIAVCKTTQMLQKQRPEIQFLAKGSET